VRKTRRGEVRGEADAARVRRAVSDGKPAEEADGSARQQEGECGGRR